MKNKNLGDWVFNWNPYNEQWRAVKRDHYIELSNNNNSPLVLRSSRFETLIDLINRTDGNKGKVISLPRTVICGNKYGTSAQRLTKEREKLPFKTKAGYLIVELKKANISKKFLLHRLVPEAFIDNLNNKAEVNHINCDKSINNVENLEWTTKIENEQHAKINGRKKFKGNQYK